MGVVVVVLRVSRYELLRRMPWASHLMNVGTLWMSGEEVGLSNGSRVRVWLVRDQRRLVGLGCLLQLSFCWLVGNHQLVVDVRVKKKNKLFDQAC